MSFIHKDLDPGCAHCYCCFQACTGNRGVYAQIPQNPIQNHMVYSSIPFLHMCISVPYCEKTVSHYAQNTYLLVQI